jgi:ribonuclease HI
MGAIAAFGAVGAITEFSAMGAIAALKAIHCTCAILYEDETLVIDAIKWACALNTMRPQLSEFRLMRSVRPKIFKVKK